MCSWAANALRVEVMIVSFLWRWEDHGPKKGPVHRAKAAALRGRCLTRKRDPLTPRKRAPRSAHGPVDPAKMDVGNERISVDQPPCDADPGGSCGGARRRRVRFTERR